MPASPDEAVNRFGFRRRDLGGTGDCAFRAFADAVAWTKNHSESDNITEAEAISQAAWYRTQTINHLSNHTADYISFFDESSRGETYQDWLERASDSSYYVNGLMLQALSTKTGTPLIIFYQDRKSKSWHRICVAAKFKDNYACASKDCNPVILQLTDSHYVSLRHPKKLLSPKDG